MRHERALPTQWMTLASRIAHCFLLSIHFQGTRQAWPINSSNERWTAAPETGGSLFSLGNFVLPILDWTEFSRKEIKLMSLCLFYWTIQSSYIVMAKSPASYLVLGAGVFGASTALSLIKKYPFASIRLVDREPFPCQVAASWDWNKMIRADYTDILYMEKALEAKHAWKWDPLFKDFYHESGSYWISDTDTVTTIADNFKRLKASDEFRLAPVDEAIHLHGGRFENADYFGVSQVLLNKTSGWAEAKKALKHVIETAVDAGVTYTIADISSLVFDDEGACASIQSSTGETFSATKIVLCTGAGTAKLIADSAPGRGDIQVGGRLVAAAICSGIVELAPDAAQKMSNIPVCVQDVLPGRGLSRQSCALFHAE